MMMDSSKSENRETVVPHSVLSAASHELRGPLGVARGYLRLLEQGGQLDARSAKAVQEAARATDRMADLLDELSTYARWARGDARLMRGPVALADVVSRALSASHLPASPAVTAAADVPAEVEVHADREQLALACAHLVSAVAQAQVADADVIVRARALEKRVEVRIAIAPELDAEGEDEEPMLERAGLGLAIALAELLIRMHGATLTERRHGRAWAGYVIRF
jgi:signal transduction histidine kinase